MKCAVHITSEILAFELGLATSGKSQVQAAYLPVLEEVCRRTRLTTYLMARSGSEAVCLLCLEGAAVIRAKPIELGQRLPLGIGAGSAAILATLEPDEAAEILEANASTYDLFPGGRAEISRMLERLAETRGCGFAYSSGTVATGVCGVGVAVLPKTGLMQLAISVSAVTDQMGFAEAQKFAAIIKAALQGFRASRTDMVAGSHR